jgi:hypothetical protein
LTSPYRKTDFRLAALDRLEQTGHPDQYFYNDAGRLKALFMAVAGINILVFYGTTALPEMKALAPGADASTRIKIIAGISPAMWIGVLICGRMLTWYRPPFFHLARTPN